MTDHDQATRNLLRAAIHNHLAKHSGSLGVNDCKEWFFEIADAEYSDIENTE